LPGSPVIKPFLHVAGAALLLLWRVILMTIVTNPPFFAALAGIIVERLTTLHIISPLAVDIRNTQVPVSTLNSDYRIPPYLLNEAQ